jgi:hypothetical protein
VYALLIDRLAIGMVRVSAHQRHDQCVVVAAVRQLICNHVCPARYVRKLVACWWRQPRLVLSTNLKRVRALALGRRLPVALAAVDLDLG